MNDEFDVGGGASAPPEKLDVLHGYLEEAIELELAIEQMDEDLKAAKAVLNTLKSQKIPAMMEEIESDNMSFRGWTVKLKAFVSGSLPKSPEARKSAIAWLERNGGESLIKTNVGLEFTRSQHNEALSIAAELEQRGWAPNVDSGVHAQTLQSFAREKIRNGEPMDEDTLSRLGLFTGTVADMKPPKAKKGAA